MHTVQRNKKEGKSLFLNLDCGTCNNKLLYIKYHFSVGKKLNSKHFMKFKMNILIIITICYSTCLILLSNYVVLKE